MLPTRSPQPTSATFLACAVHTAIADIATDGRGVSVTFHPGPEPAIQTVAGRQVACHLHGVKTRDGGTHVGDPADRS